MAPKHATPAELSEFRVGEPAPATLYLVADDSGTHRRVALELTEAEQAEAKVLVEQGEVFTQQDEYACNWHHYVTQLEQETGRRSKR